MEPETEATSKIEPTELEEQQRLKEKIGNLMNWVQRKFKGINQVTNKQEKTTVEETLNLPKESETEDSLQQNEPPNLPEIVEELPIPQSAEEMPPQETSSLTPNVEEVTESLEEYSLPVVVNSQQETTPELEQIIEHKSEAVVESILPKSDDYAQDVSKENEPENTPNSVESVTE